KSDPPWWKTLKGVTEYDAADLAVGASKCVNTTVQDNATGFPAEAAHERQVTEMSRSNRANGRFHLQKGIPYGITNRANFIEIPPSCDLAFQHKDVIEAPVYSHVPYEALTAFRKNNRAGSLRLQRVNFHVCEEESI